jgi:hypothetical protein
MQYLCAGLLSGAVLAVGTASAPAQNLPLGEMTAAPFFHGGRIYLRTYTHLYCIGK